MDSLILGKYELFEHLARGGMADVYLARSKGPAGFERLFVVKVLLPDLAREERFTHMFLDEAKIAASLQHANIVQVYEVGVSGGQYFMSMEFLNGSDLAGLIATAAAERRLIPLEQVIHIATGVLAGLHYAHEFIDQHGEALGIIHRDVSPHNVFVTRDGLVKLMDFGIAKAKNRTTKTQAGVIKGKRGYLSPEQVRGQTLDRRSDLYSLSVTLWEMLSLRRLHHAKDTYELVRNIIDRDPLAPSVYAPHCPPELDAIVAKGLSRRRNERFSTALEMQNELEELARKLSLAFSPAATGRWVCSLVDAERDATRVWRRDLDIPTGELEATATVVDPLPYRTSTPFSEAETEAGSVASEPMAAPPEEPKWPVWPLLLVAMALVLIGVLGYLAVQDPGRRASSHVAPEVNTPPRPVVGGEPVVIEPAPPPSPPQPPPVRVSEAEPTSPVPAVNAEEPRQAPSGRPSKPRHSSRPTVRRTVKPAQKPNKPPANAEKKAWDHDSPLLPP